MFKVSDVIKGNIDDSEIFIVADDELEMTFKIGSVYTLILAKHVSLFVSNDQYTYYTGGLRIKRILIILN